MLLKQCFSLELNGGRFNVLGVIPSISRTTTIDSDIESDILLGNIGQQQHEAGIMVNGWLE